MSPKDGELILLQLVYKRGPNLFGRDYRVTMAEGGYYGSVSWIRLPENHTSKKFD